MSLSELPDAEQLETWVLRIEAEAALLARPRDSAAEDPDLAELERLARAALPEVAGRWRYRKSPVGPPYGYVEWGPADKGLGTATLNEPLARYLAALSPDVVLRLLARRAPGDRDALRKYARHDSRCPALDIPATTCVCGLDRALAADSRPEQPARDREP